MWTSSASRSAPKIEAEKSVPFLPSVVCSPSRSRAMKPVTTSVVAGSSGTARAADARERSHCTRGPSKPHSTVMTSRASIQLTLPRLVPTRCRYRAKSRLDQSSPNPATVSRTTVEPARTVLVSCSRRSISRQSAATESRYWSEAAASRSDSAIAACRSFSAERIVALEPASPFPATRSNASVTPPHADRTTARRGDPSRPTISATRAMRSASARLEPPNLYTRQRSMRSSYWAIRSRQNPTRRHTSMAAALLSTSACVISPLKTACTSVFPRR